jgi:ParB-like chromosome segregation protein Spo0J
MFDSEMPDDDDAEAETVRDTRLEAILDRWGLTYELQDEYPLRRLKIAEETQARSADHRQPSSSVDEYATHMKNGAQFPPILIASNGMLVDGNTRAAAAERIGRDSIAAYVVKLGNLELGKLIAAAINQTNGRRLASEELVAAAEGYLDAGYTEEAVARELGCSISHVRNVRRERTYRDAATRVGTDELKIGKPQQRVLAGVTHDEPFRAAATLVAETNPTAKDTSALVDELTKARSDADAVAIVNAKRQEWAPAGPPPRRVVSSAKPTKALKVVRQLVEMIGDAPGSVVRIGDNQAEHAAAWRELEGLVVQVVALYGTETPRADD